MVTDAGMQIQTMTAFNRETGANPVRTRHCKRGVPGQYVTEKSGRRLCMLLRKSGDLPAS